MPYASDFGFSIEGQLPSPTPKFDVVEWMAQHGHPGYKHKIEGLRIVAASVESRVADLDEPTRTEAEFWLESIESQVAEITREAQDRYDDWATDPDY